MVRTDSPKAKEEKKKLDEAPVAYFKTFPSLSVILIISPKEVI